MTKPKIEFREMTEYEKLHVMTLFKLEEIQAELGEFDIRYLGQSVATICISKDNKVICTPKTNSNSQYFGCNISGEFEWNSVEGTNFRRVFKEYDIEAVKTKSLEHRVENMLLEQFSLISANSKSLLNEMKERGFTMLVRPSQYKLGKYWRFTDLVTNTIPKAQRAVTYSMWGGYLDRKSTRNQHHMEYLERFGENVERLHTSGHATRECLVELCEMTSPRFAIIPIHSEQSVDYQNLPLCDELKAKITMSSTICENVEIVI